LGVRYVHCMRAVLGIESAVSDDNDDEDGDNKLSNIKKII